MRPLRLLAILLLLGLAACSTGTLVGTSILIDQPTAPFPYNSLICP